MKYATTINAGRAELWEFNDGRLYELSSGKKTELNKQYIKSSWAYACMDIRGQELSNLPWRITRNGEVVEDHPLYEILEQFGPESNWDEAIKSTEIDLLMFGAAFWLRDIDVLKRLNPQTIEVKKNKDGIFGFWQTIDETVVNKFNRDEVIYFREYNPDDDLGVGIPVMEVAKKAIGTEYEALRYTEAYFKNNAQPGLFVTTEQTVPDKEKRRLLDVFTSKHRGSDKAGKTVIADRGLKADRIGFNMGENAVVEIRDQARNDICVAFRVPKVLIGDMNEATYVNLSESRRFLIEDLILPRAKQLEDVINQDLVRFVDPSVKFEFAEDELQILQEDATEKHTRLAEAFQLGLITKSFYIQEMGYPQDAEAPDMGAEAEQKWEKKAQKAFKRGESPAVEFDTDEITIDRQITIRARLMNAETEEDIRKAFK